MQDQRKTLRIGIVGCGRVAQHHLRFITGLKNTAIVGVADKDLETARRLGRNYQIQNIYGSLEDLLDSTPLDILHILTPPTNHYTQAVAAIEHGLHVLVEKPLTLCARETEELYRLAEKKGVLICPDFIQLFHPAFQKARTIVDSGRLGRVIHIESRLSLDLSTVTELWETVGLHWSYQLPGGVLQNYLTHPLYLALNWLGIPNKVSVNARSYDALPQKLTDHLDILLEGEHCSAFVSLSVAMNPEHYYVQVFCENGSVMVNFDTSSVIVTRKGRLPRSIRRATSNFRHAYQLSAWGIKNILRYIRRQLVPYEGLQILISSFYASIKNGADPPVSRELSVAVTRTEEEIFQNAGRLHVDSNRQPSRQVGITRPEKVLVTGATGYVGVEVVQQLVRSGFYVRALSRRLSQTEKLQRLGVEIIDGDVRDLDSLSKAARDVDVVVHLAAALRGSREFILDCCVKGTENIAKASRVNGIKRVIYMSSLSVYDYFRLRNGDVITEESPLEEHPELRGVYSLAKRQAEDVALSRLSDNSPAWTILRPSLIVGKNRDIFAPLSGVKLGSFFVCLGTPRKKLRLIHVEDVAVAILKLIQNDSTRGGIFTLSSPDSLTLRDYIEGCVRIHNSDIRVLYVPYSIVWLIFTAFTVLNKLTRKGPRLSQQRLAYLYRDVGAGSDRIKEYLGWQPQRNLLPRISHGPGLG